jgi:hypothetical protein
VGGSPEPKKQKQKSQKSKNREKGSDCFCRTCRCRNDLHRHALLFDCAGPHNMNRHSSSSCSMFNYSCSHVKIIKKKNKNSSKNEAGEGFENLPEYRVEQFEENHWTLQSKKCERGRLGDRVHMSAELVASASCWYIIRWCITAYRRPREGGHWRLCRFVVHVVVCCSWYSKRQGRESTMT